MSQTTNLHRGMVLRHEGHLFTVLDFHQIQKGKQKPTVHVKLRSVSTGNVGERTLDELGKLDEVPTAVRKVQYLYADRDQRIFMDTESFDQIALSPQHVGGAEPWLVEQETYALQTIDGEPILLTLPPVVVLEVVDTAPPQHGGGGSTVYKEARLTSGALVMVPLFIKNGDRIRVKTDNREYQGKEH